MPVATERRLSDELNITADLEHVYYFCYQASFGEAGSENELCHVYLGRVSSDVRANESEIDSVRFVTAGDLDREFENRPQQFTPWFKQEWRSLRDNFGEQLLRYAM